MIKALLTHKRRSQYQCRKCLIWKNRLGAGYGIWLNFTGRWCKSCVAAQEALVLGLIGTIMVIKAIDDEREDLPELEGDVRSLIARMPREYERKFHLLAALFTASITRTAYGHAFGNWRLSHWL